MEKSELHLGDFYKKMANFNIHHLRSGLINTSPSFVQSYISIEKAPFWGGVLSVLVLTRKYI